MCEAAFRAVAMSGPGVLLSYGRRRRKASPAQLRALQLRDRGCRTPGCGRTRFLHAHHVVFWMLGGSTDLDNLLLLCTACHRAVHQGKLRIRALGRQRFEFAGGDGTTMTHAPPTHGTADLLRSRRTVEPELVGGAPSGYPLRLAEVTAWLLTNWVSAARERGALPQYHYPQYHYPQYHYQGAGADHYQGAGTAST
jgi:hypothetical protein